MQFRKFDEDLGKFENNGNISKRHRKIKNGNERINSTR